MNIRSVMIASVLATGLAVPAMAETAMHRYAIVFKYSDASVKAMTENPQDRLAPVVKLYESFGGKVESAYWFATGGQYDGIIVALLPDDVTEEALSLTVRATGALANAQSMALLTAEEFKAAMEKAKSVKSNYSPPAQTKQ